MAAELRLYISEGGVDDERLAELANYLRQELLQLDVDGVAPLPAGELPPGARGSSMADAAGGLLVTLSQSADGLRLVVAAIRDWVRRGEGADRIVRLELDGDTLDLSRASAADQQRLIELFASRHATATDSP